MSSTRRAPGRPAPSGRVGPTGTSDGGGQGPDQEIRVLHSLRWVRPTTNPYLVLLRKALRSQPGLQLLDFGFRRALFASYDAFHLHWPEIFLEGGSRAKKAGRQLLLVLVLLRLTTTRTPVVRTRHNLERPSGLRWHEHRLLDWIDRLTRVTIVLNPETPPLPGTTPVLVKHGHYRDWFAGHSTSPRQEGQFGYAGLIRRYKGVENLVDAFSATRDQESVHRWSLRIGGMPSTPELAETITTLSAGDDRITLQLRFLDDIEFVDLITSSELVVLPYRFMHNSGSALAALSLDRPVLVPDNQVNRELAAEVGPGWVHLFAGEITPADLVAAVDSRARSGRPDLDDRDWDEVGRGHLAAYRLALGLRAAADASVDVAR